MSKQDLDDPGVGIIAQDICTLDLGYGAVPPDYGNISYSGGVDTITIDSSTMYGTGTITLPTTTITCGKDKCSCLSDVYLRKESKSNS